LINLESPKFINPRLDRLKNKRWHLMFAEKLGIDYECKLNEHLSFDDVSLLPSESGVEPYEVDLSTWLTPEHVLAVPIISSPMDRVTEVEMCIALAREGGLGVLHRNCSIEKEVEMVKRVKREEISGIIRDPVTTTPDTPISSVIKLMQEKRVSGLPVVDQSGELVGIITRRDVLAAKPDALVKDEMTPREKLITCVENEILVNGRLMTEKVKEILHSNRIEKLLVLNSEGHLSGLVTFKDILRLEENPYVSRDSEGRLMVGAAISPFDRRRALALDAAGVDVLVVDVAHGLNLNALSSMEKISKEVNAWIIYGNIATREAAEKVISSDIENLAGLRVGLGGGSICLTTHVTGVGVPTLTATALVADAVHESKAKLSVIADGGIRNSGDIVKALGAGASAVMCGYLFAGTDEAPSEKVYIRGVPMKRYRGMASPSAIRERFAADRYARKVKEVPEGVEGVVPYRGSVRAVVRDLVAAIQAGFGYIGAKNIEDLWRKAVFNKRTIVGMHEALPHDVLPETQFPEKYDKSWF